MFLRISSKYRLRLTIALIIGLVVVGTIVAHSHGPNPDRGATYQATLVVSATSHTPSRKLPMSFRVDDSGTHVGDFRFPNGLPTTCPGSEVIAGAGPVASGSAPIVSPSRFNVKLPIHLRATRATSPVIGTVQISGEFHTFHHEGGAVATTFTMTSQMCGTGAGYTAKS